MHAMTDRDETRALLDAERADLLALLRDLSAEEWNAPSLCEGWRVREVAGHLLHDTIPPTTYLAIVARCRFGVDRVNNSLATKAGAMPTGRIVEKLERDHGRTSSLWPSLILSDMLVHHQDILRPLGRTREIPPPRLRAALDRPDPFAFPWRRTRGLRWVATDLDWSKGRGTEVRGTGEALALAIAGRPVVLDELEGDGVAVLRSRMG